MAPGQGASKRHEISRYAISHLIKCRIKTLSYIVNQWIIIARNRIRNTAFRANIITDSWRLHDLQGGCSECRADVIENGTDFIDKKPNVIVNTAENGTNGTNKSEFGTDNGTDGTDKISREDAIVNLMRKNKRISIKEISARLNIPRRTLFRIIDALKTSNRIRSGKSRAD